MRLIGRLIAEVRAIVQGVRERRRALRSLLFELLEVRYRVSVRNPEQFLPVLVGFVSDRFGPEAAAALRSTPVEAVINQALHTAVSAMSDVPIGPLYASAVQALAPYAPILAYRLRGKDRLVKLDELFTNYFDKALSLPVIAKDPAAVAMRADSEAALVQLAYRDAMKELASNVRRVARALSPWTYFKSRRVLSRQASPPQEEIRRLIGDWLNALPQVGGPDLK